MYLQIYVRPLLEERLRAVVGVVEYPGALHGDCGRRPGAGFATVLTAAPRPRLGCGVIHGPGPLVAGPSVGPPARLPMLIGWVTAVPVKAAGRLEALKLTWDVRAGPCHDVWQTAAF